MNLKTKALAATAFIAFSASIRDIYQSDNEAFRSQKSDFNIIKLRRVIFMAISQKMCELRMYRDFFHLFGYFYFFLQTTWKMLKRMRTRNPRDARLF